MPIDLGRRRTVVSTLTAAAWLLFDRPSLAALPASLPALGSSGQPTYAEFSLLSEILTGRDDLDTAMGRRIHALISAEPYGPQHVARVYDRIRGLLAIRPQPGRAELLLPGRFDDGERWFIGHLLVTWYTGAYYHARGNDRPGFESALMYRVLEDLRPAPSNCRGFGYWASPPRLARPIE